MNNIQPLKIFLQTNLRRNSKEDYTIDGILIGKNDIKVTARKNVGFRILPHYKEYTINLEKGQIIRTSTNPYKSRIMPIQRESLKLFNHLVSNEINDRRFYKCPSEITNPNEQLFKILEKTMQSFFSICKEGKKKNDTPVKDIVYYSNGIKCSTKMGLDHRSLCNKFGQALKSPQKKSALIHIPCTESGHINNDQFFKREVDGNLIIGLLDGVGSAGQFSNAKNVSRQFLEKLTDKDYLDIIQNIDLIGSKENAEKKVCNDLKTIINKCSQKDKGEFTFAIIFNLPSGIHTFFKGDTQVGIYDIENKSLEVFTKNKINSNNLYAERSFTTLADSIVPNTNDWNLSYNYNSVKNNSTLFLVTDGISDLFPLITGKQAFFNCPKDVRTQVDQIFKKLNRSIPNQLSYIVHDVDSIESIFNICEGDPGRIKKVLEIFCNELAMTKKDDRTGYFLKIGNEKNDLDITYHGEHIRQFGDKLNSHQQKIKSEDSNHSCASTARLTDASSRESLLM